MRLLFDNNLSDRLPAILAVEFPKSLHVRHIGLKSADDSEIWEFAANQGLAIVSKDSDFQQRAMLYGAPPKVVWLRVGNCATARIVSLLQTHQPDLIAFNADATASLLVLS
jgi:predicted nuclease of predicted toxin-antitoxin system